jgi:RND family efflux transporter MFP subunit
MKRTAKTAAYIGLVIAISSLAFFQLQKNKNANAEMAQLANVQGEYYPVKTLKIESTNQQTSISTTGFLASATDLIVLSETQGTIEEIHKEKGDVVEVGDVIAAVDDEMLQARFNAAEASYIQMQKEVERFTRLLEKNAVTSQKVEEIKLNMKSAEANYISTKRQLENTKIKAPVTGFIENDFIEVGQYIGGGSKVCNIIDTYTLKLKISVSESDYKYLKLGQRASISSKIYPQKKFNGKLSYIGQKAGYGNTFDAEIKVYNTDNLLKPGMFVEVDISEQHDTQTIYIPRRAVMGSLKEAKVFVVVDDVTETRSVTTGNVNNDMVEVLDGLNENDQLVIDGNYNLYEGARIKVIK